MLPLLVLLQCSVRCLFLCACVCLCVAVFVFDRVCLFVVFVKVCVCAFVLGVLYIYNLFWWEVVCC